MSEGIALETRIPRLWDMQSQLAVGQESIQFIPPHPSTGQRNQFRFWGAIQALPEAQIGHRGQSVGRSQGQIRVTQQKRSGP